MEIKQVSYILTIAEEGSITRAAEKLYMTQSALNQQLLRLERELGVELFTRSGRGMTPTFAGKIYLENARKIQELRNLTYKQLGDISEVKYGEISIGYTPERGVDIFTKMFLEFHKKYPGITFSTVETVSLQLAAAVLQKRVTMGLVSYETENPDLVYHHPTKESIIVAMPVSFPLAKLAGERSWETLPTLSLKQLAGEKLILSNHDTRLRTILDSAFEDHGFVPNVILETSISRIMVILAENQIGAAFLPQWYAKPSDKLVYFRLEEDIFWNIAIVTHKDTYLNKAEKDLIDIYADLRDWGVF